MPPIQNMSVKIAVTSAALLLAACGGESDDSRKNESGLMDRVDSCDLREISGTCVEYTLSELDDWYREHVERACPSNRRGELAGKYMKDSRCPAENRVARCEGIVEDPSERYEYDKHHYFDTAEGYSWEPKNVQVTCEQVSGQFVPE
jgi:hypothetical protein